MVTCAQHGSDVVFQDSAPNPYNNNDGDPFYRGTLFGDGEFLTRYNIYVGNITNKDVTYDGDASYSIWTGVASRERMWGHPVTDIKSGANNGAVNVRPQHPNASA